MSPLAGKVALVTGSSRGIGAAIVHRLVSDGANVIVNYVSNDAAAESVLKELNAVRPNAAVALKADMSSPSTVSYLAEEALKAFGKVDIVVLNAGVMGAATLSEVTEEYYNHVFDANVKGPLFLTKALAPHLASGMPFDLLTRRGYIVNSIKGSRIVFFSSSLTAVDSLLPNTLVYVASKGAVEQMTRALSKELGAKGINVNCISPGPIDTALFRNGKPEQVIQHITNLHPQKRLGQPDEISGAVALLAGPDGSWINGQNIRINGVSGFAVKTECMLTPCKGYSV